MLTKKYQSQPSVIASYDAVDVLSGTGLTNLYAGEVCLSGASIDYLLSSVRYYSNKVCTANYTGTNSAFTQQFDLDFDVLINRPTTIEGITNVNIPIHITHSGGTAGSSSTAYIVAKIRKWDGTTETEIASNTSKLFQASYGTNNYDISAVYLDIPETTFKVGEYLRLTCIGYAQRTQDGDYVVTMAYDPMNRSLGWDAAGSPSSLIFQMPQRIDL